MNEENRITIIGGDLRILNVAKILSSKKIIYTYGLEEANIYKNHNIKKCKTIDEAISASNIIITSIPISKDGEYINSNYSNKKINIKEFTDSKFLKDKLIISGKVIGFDNISEKNEILDVTEKEEFAILNAISTAEGAIALAINETDIILNNSNILILGFGRIGKELSYRLKGLNANVYCTARKEEDFAWMESYGIKKVNYNNLELTLNKMSVIFNTVPKKILKKEQYEKIDKNCFIIDLASYPGGIDFEICKEMKLKSFLYLGIPGKVAPKTSAQIIIKMLNKKISNIK